MGGGYFPPRASSPFQMRWYQSTPSTSRVSAKCGRNRVAVGKSRGTTAEQLIRSGLAAAPVVGVKVGLGHLCWSMGVRFSRSSLCASACEHPS